MPYYRYKLVTKSGEKIEAIFVGKKDDLVNEVAGQGGIIISIKEEKASFKRGTFKFKDFSEGIEELSYLVKAGLPLDKAIKTISENSSKYSSKEFWEAVNNEVKSGKLLSAALQQTSVEKKIEIPGFYISILSVGEEVGDISGSLKVINENIEFRREVGREIKSALSYPAFLLAVSIITIFFVSGFVLPKFSSIFSAEELQRLPLLSKILLSFGRVIENNFSAVVISVVGIVAFLVYIFSLPKSRQLGYQIVRKIPILESVFNKSDMAGIFNALGVMISGGLDIRKAVSRAANYASTETLRNILEETKNDLQKGGRISSTWAKFSVIPNSVTSLVMVGENSASLDEIFAKLGDRYMEEFKSEVSKLLSVLEPMIIILLGLVIGTIVVAIMLSVISISDFY